MNQKLKILMMLTLVALTLSSCACSGGTTATPRPSPSAMTATPVPTPVETPAPSPMPEESMPTAPDDGTTASPEGAEGPTMMGIDTAKLILELEKLSEVDTADVVAMDGRALVGLHFDAQYQGTLTERIEEMVVGAVTGIEAALTDIAVTADPTLVTEIKTLSTEMTDAEPTAEQKAKFDELYAKIKPASSDAAADK